jgi:adenosylhomocysteine nucleosidase
MSTLICFALKEEAAPFRKMARRRRSVFTLIVGIGRANAEKAVREFLGSAPAPGAASDAPVAGVRREGVPNCSRGGCAPQLVLTCGFAGGLNPDLKIGDVVFEVQRPMSNVQSQLLAAGAKPVKFFCADRIATTVAEKKQLRVETGADAVEMESAAIHAACAERGIPCVTVRVISDPAGEDLPLDFNALAKPDRSLDFGKLAWAIAKSPGKIGALMALQKQTKLAAERLAAVLDRIIRQR